MSIEYFTITGRSLDLAALSKEEQKFLGEALKKVRRGIKWSRFGAWWLKAFEKAGFDETSPVQRICRDLEARVGITEGKVAPPDYRDFLAELIEERFGSRYKFCEKTGIDAGQLSRVFAGKAHLSMELLTEASAALSARLVVRSNEDLQKDFSQEQAMTAEPEGIAGLAERES